MGSFSNLDLNLLKVFAAMYQTGSVTQSADQLNLSQSACSHALTRLRERLSDELFIRVDNKMLPTEYARHLAPNILPALALLNKGLESSRPFCAQERHVFRIAATDYTSWCMQPFLAEISQHYPSIDIEFLQLERRLPVEELKQGEIDLVCGFSHQEESNEALEHLIWFEDKYVNVRCKLHPAQNSLTLEQFLTFPHVLITPWNEPRGIIDFSLAQLKKKRRIGLKTASVLAAPHFVIDTHNLLSIPSRYADHVCQTLPLITDTLPLQVPNYQLMLYWHRTLSKSSKLEWFIEQFSMFHQSTLITAKTQ